MEHPGMSLCICGRALQTLHCTIPARQTNEHNMETETERCSYLRSVPGCWISQKNCRLVKSRSDVAPDKQSPSESCACLPLRTTAHMREVGCSLEEPCFTPHPVPAKKKNMRKKNKIERRENNAPPFNCWRPPTISRLCAQQSVMLCTKTGAHPSSADNRRISSRSCLGSSAATEVIRNELSKADPPSIDRRVLEV